MVTYILLICHWMKCSKSIIIVLVNIYSNTPHMWVAVVSCAYKDLKVTKLLEREEASDQISARRDHPPCPVGFFGTTHLSMHGNSFSSSYHNITNATSFSTALHSQMLNMPPLRGLAHLSWVSLIVHYPVGTNNGPNQKLQAGQRNVNTSKKFWASLTANFDVWYLPKTDSLSAFRTWPG